MSDICDETLLQDSLSQIVKPSPILSEINIIKRSNPNPLAQSRRGMPRLRNSGDSASLRDGARIGWCMLAVCSAIFRMGGSERINVGPG